MRLSGAAGARDDDRLGVAGLTLEPDYLLDNLGELGTLLTMAGGCESQGVPHVTVRVHGEHDGTNISLEEKKEYDSLT